jgi:hypothetical protein
MSLLNADPSTFKRDFFDCIAGAVLTNTVIFAKKLDCTLFRK